MLNLLVLLATVLAVTSATAPKSVEEAHKIIQDHVKSFGTGVGGLCDKNKCCTVSSTESCPISNMEKDSSTLVLPGGNTRCIFSDSTPFAFQVSRQFLFILSPDFPESFRSSLEIPIRCYSSSKEVELVGMRRVPQLHFAQLILPLNPWLDCSIVPILRTSFVATPSFMCLIALVIYLVVMLPARTTIRRDNQWFKSVFSMPNLLSIGLNNK